jgi:hypothetical protein
MLGVAENAVAFPGAEFRGDPEPGHECGLLMPQVDTVTKMSRSDRVILL